MRHTWHGYEKHDEEDEDDKVGSLECLCGCVCFNIFHPAWTLDLVLSFDQQQHSFFSFFVLALTSDTTYINSHSSPLLRYPQRTQATDHD